MTSISASMQSAHHASPLSRLQQTLASGISAGKIASGDESALTSALQSIDTAMQAARTSGTKPTPEDGKAKVESMIADMVSAGTLTADQASELKAVFEDTFAGGPGGAKGKMGPPPPPPEDSESEDSDSSVSLTLTGSSSDITALLKQLLEGLASQGSGTYSSSATANSNVSSLFLDKTA